MRASVVRIRRTPLRPRRIGEPIGISSSSHAGVVLRVSASYRRDLNVLVSRGIGRMFRVAESEYRRTLDAHAVLDFSDLLLRALDLLRRMEDFAQSRYRLESRYHHVLVDEFQDTSRAQWELVSLLIQSWGEGAGLAHSGPLQPSIFIVGDRKQSIYAFRDAEVSVLREASRYLEGLRPDRDVRRSISRSFRAVPPILAFINDVCRDMDKAPDRSDAFEYGESDHFPIDPSGSDRRRGIPGDGRGRHVRGLRRGHGGGNRPAPVVGGHGPRSRDRRPSRHPRRRHRDPLPHAGKPPRVRSGARAARHPVVRLQGARVLRLG